MDPAHDLSSGLMQLVYVSTAVQPFTEDDLLAMLVPIRIRNQLHDVTGLLVFHDGRFFQVLEGPEDAVLTIYDRIRDDRRHHDLEELYRGEVAERLFGEWSMGLVHTDGLPAGPRPGVVDFLRSGIGNGSGSEVQRLLIGFRDGLLRENLDI